MTTPRAITCLLAICSALLSGCHAWHSDRVYRDENCPIHISTRFHDACGCGQSTCQGDCELDACTSCKEYGLLTQIWRALTCGGGCGEVYVGEWISDPPQRRCDDCGHWVGEQCKRPLFWRLHGLRGRRFHEDHSCSGCSACGSDVMGDIPAGATSYIESYVEE